MTRAALVGVACVLAAAAGASAQRAPAIVSRPEGSAARAAEWVDAVLTHVPGTADGPTRIVSKWTQPVLTNVQIELASIRRLIRDPKTKVFPFPIELDRGGPKEIRYSASERNALDKAASQAVKAGAGDADLMARGIVLHTDVATLNDGTGRMLRYADGERLNLDVRIADHWVVARALADTLDNKSGRRADVARWYHATLAWMASMQMWNADQAQRALAWFPDDAGLRFLVGCLHETLASSRTQSAITNGRLPAGIEVHVRSARGELDEAASLLRRALALDPGDVEARVHYGRVLTLTGEAKAAAAELRRAAGQVRDPAQQYYAQLFLGAALASAGQSADAEAAYRAAAMRFPRAQAPRLALSELAFTSGDRARAAEAIAPVFALEADEDGRQDPWWSYFVSCGRDAEALLAEAGRRLATPLGGESR